LEIFELKNAILTERRYHERESTKNEKKIKKSKQGARAVLKIVFYGVF